MQGSFWWIGRCEGFAEYGFAPDLWVVCVGRVYAFRKCRLIPPHQSLTRQLPPEGKPSLHCANMANNILCCGLALRLARRRRMRAGNIALAHHLVVQCEKTLAKRLPLGGKLARQRLMRGDIFALPRGMYLSHETERPVCRSAFRSLTNLNHFYPVAERSNSCPNPAGRDLARSSRNSQHGIRLHQNLHKRKARSENPLA